jgi:ABC-type branched-subunit amino acid transport system substrate-binding protein
MARELRQPSARLVKSGRPSWPPIEGEQLLKIRRLACALVAIALVLGVSAMASGSAGAAKKAPVIKIILLAETKGESSAAVAYYANGAQLAADELGAKVEYTRIPTPLTPAAALTALNQAIDQKPNLIIGFPSSAQIIALAPTIKSSGIPVLGLSSGEQTVANGPYGAPNLFLIRPVDTNIAVEETEYVINTLKAKKIGLECVDNATGVNGCNAAKKVIEANKKKGVSVFVERTNSTTATDMGEQARAMQGADVVLDFNFPNPLGVMSNALVANGVNVPHVDGASAGIQAAAGLVKGPAATNLKGVDDCVPTDQTDKKSTKFVTDYKAKFAGETPVYSAAQVYDMVHFAADIAAKQGAVTPKAVIKGLSTQAWSGVCADYKGDAIQVLSHTADIVKFDANGVETIEKELTFAPGQLPFTVVTTIPTTTVAPTTTTKAP